MKKDTWLVTGGAGFIGSHFVRSALTDQNIDVIVLDSLTYAGNLERLADLTNHPNYLFVHGNICDQALVENIFTQNNITKVIHFAAESHVDRSIEGPKDFFKTNIEGTFILLEAARKHWKECKDKLFLHVSTDEVYGSLLINDPAFTESSQYKPSSPYSASKAAADHLVHAWQKTYEFPAVITNCSNNYGAWQYPEKLIPLVILNVLENKKIPIYGNGLQRRSWLHVIDHCNALLLIINKHKVGEHYLIGHNEEWANIDLVNLICDLVDEFKNQPVGTSRGLISYVKDRPGHDIRYAINSTKLSTELGWQPKYHFKSSLRELIQWYIHNRKWAESLRDKDYQKFYQKNYQFAEEN